MGREGHKVKQITFCTDNDKAGREFANRYYKLMSNSISAIDLSKKKDWNEELNQKFTRVFFKTVEIERK